MSQQTARIALLHAPGTAMIGHQMTNAHAIELIAEGFPGRHFCLVRDWIWVDLDLPETVREKLNRIPLLPVMLYANCVVTDSLGRFDAGDWLRSTPLVSFTQGCLFETRDTVYALLGHGVRKRAELSAMVKIFRVERE